MKLLGALVAWATQRMQAASQARTNGLARPSNSSQAAPGAVSQCPVQAIQVAPTPVQGVAPVPRSERNRPFTLPSLEFLVAQSAAPAPERDEESLQAMGEKLLSTLGAFGVQGKVEEVTTGPTLTTFEVSPAPGTKVSKVAGIDDDLSLALGRKVRVLGPIPGKSRLGFEMARRRPPRWLCGTSSRTSGSRASRARFRSSWAGTAWAGRSTGTSPRCPTSSSRARRARARAWASTSCCSRCSTVARPRELRFLMIDPKVVELAPFEGIPHMLRPVVTDMAEAAQALQWAPSEMDRRFRMFASAGAKSLASYNARASEKLPSIVVVIEEYADLVMQQGKAVGTW